MGKIVKITDSTGECIEIHYDDNGKIIGKTSSNSTGTGENVPVHTGSSGNKTNPAESEVAFSGDGNTVPPDVSIKKTESNNVRSTLTESPLQMENDVPSHNIDKSASDHEKPAGNYNEEYENFRKTHTTYASNRSSDFSSSAASSSSRNGIIVLAAIFAIIVIAIGIFYKCNNSNGRSPSNSPTAIKEGNPDQTQTPTPKEQANQSATIAYFKFQLNDVPPDCTVRVLSPVITLPNGSKEPATILTLKVEGNELTVWTIQPYPVGSSLDGELVFVKNAPEKH